MEARDAAQATALCEQLGYPTELSSLRERLQQIARSPDRAVLVACAGDELLGWIDLSVEVHLQSPPVVLIGGLVVAESARGRGTGRQLCLAAERWARERGFSRIRVRSNAIRDRAHAFYLRDGYQRVKTSAVFEKELPADASAVKPVLD